jgi:hypothetical protein
MRQKEIRQRECNQVECRQKVAGSIGKTYVWRVAIAFLWE